MDVRKTKEHGLMKLSWKKETKICILAHAIRYLNYLKEISGKKIIRYLVSKKCVKTISLLHTINTTKDYQQQQKIYINFL